jgi:hypothetical protein
MPSPSGRSSPAQRPLLAAARASKGQIIDGAAARILIVDDAPINCKLLARTFNKVRHTTLIILTFLPTQLSLKPFLHYELYLGSKEFGNCISYHSYSQKWTRSGGLSCGFTSFSRCHRRGEGRWAPLQPHLSRPPNAGNVV